MAEALKIVERTGYGLAAVMARKGVTAAELGERLGLTPPSGPQIVTDDALALIGTGPAAWLALADDGQAGWAEQLGHALSGIASVSDQSAGFTIFRMSGSGARDLLQSGAFIDFHPDVFGRGTAAVTVIAHIGVVIWQVDDGPTFDVALFRSFAGSFRAWIAASPFVPPDFAVLDHRAP